MVIASPKRRARSDWSEVTCTRSASSWASTSRPSVRIRDRSMSLRTDRAERDALRAKLGNEARRRLHGLALILERRRLVAVVHDDDIAVRNARPDALHDRVRGALAEPVPVPQHPAPANHPVIDLVEARVHG